MKKIISLVFAAAIALAGCDDKPRATHHVRASVAHQTFSVQNQNGYAFNSGPHAGTYGYPGPDGSWYYYAMVTNSNNTSPSFGVSTNNGTTVAVPPAQGTWVKGEAPTPNELDASAPSAIAVTEAEGGAPVSAAEATSEAAAEAAAESAAESAEAAGEAAGESAGGSGGAGSSSGGGDSGGSSGGGDSGGSSGGGDGGSGGGGE